MSLTSFHKGNSESFLFYSLDCLAVTEMLPRLWISGIHALSVVAMSLSPLQVTDLPSSRPLYDLIPNTSDATNSHVFSPFYAHPPSLLISNQSSSRQNRAVFQCDGTRFGKPSYDSCIEAYAWIPNGKENLKYGDRNGPDNPDVPLPLRYSSST